MRKRRLTVDEWPDVLRIDASKDCHDIAQRGRGWYRLTCPVGCGRLSCYLYFRWSRWGCRECQDLGHRSEQVATLKRARKAVARLLAAGTPLALTERELILLSGIQE